MAAPFQSFTLGFGGEKGSSSRPAAASVSRAFPASNPLLNPLSKKPKEFPYSNLVSHGGGVQVHISFVFKESIYWLFIFRNTLCICFLLKIPFIKISWLLFSIKIPWLRREHTLLSCQFDVVRYNLVHCRLLSLFLIKIIIIIIAYLLFCVHCGGKRDSLTAMSSATEPQFLLPISEIQLRSFFFQPGRDSDSCLTPHRIWVRLKRASGCHVS